MWNDPNAKSIPIPPADGIWTEDISWFALTWNGYERVGELGDIKEIAERVERAAQRGKPLEATSVEDLRTALFFFQRRSHWTDHNPTKKVLAAVVSELRARFGDEIPGPPDELI